MGGSISELNEEDLVFTYIKTGKPTLVIISPNGFDLFIGALDYLKQEYEIIEEPLGTFVF